MPQPIQYTEPPGHAEIEIDIPDRSCFTCGNQEPFGETRYVVWCFVHTGHVPITCWCDQWRPGPDALLRDAGDCRRH